MFEFKVWGVGLASFWLRALYRVPRPLSGCVVRYKPPISWPLRILQILQIQICCSLTVDTLLLAFALQSTIFQNHRSAFFRDRSKAINLAELVCNEIKQAITIGHVNGPDEIQRHLDHLTEITTMCQLKSKKLDPNMKTGLIDYDDRSQTVDSKSTDEPATTSKNPNKRCRLKRTSNNRTRVCKSKMKSKNHGRNMWKNIQNDT